MTPSVDFDELISCIHPPQQQVVLFPLLSNHTFHSSTVLCICRCQVLVFVSVRGLKLSLVELWGCKREEAPVGLCVFHRWNVTVEPVIMTKFHYGS